MIEWNDWENYSRFSKKLVDNNGSIKYEFTVIDELNTLTGFLYDYLFELCIVDYLIDEKVAYQHPLKLIAPDIYTRFKRGEFLNSFRLFINQMYIKPVISVLSQKPFLIRQYLDVILMYKRNVRKALKSKHLSQHTMQYVYVLIDELESILINVKERVKLIPNEVYFQELERINFYYRLFDKYSPTKVDSIIATLGRTRDYGGRMIDNQADYFRFCVRIGLIKFLEDEGYHENEAASFLDKISGFENSTSKKNFRDYYKHRDIKSSSKFILKEDSFEFAEHILSKLK